MSTLKIMISYDILDNNLKIGYERNPDDMPFGWKLLREFKKVGFLLHLLFFS